VPLLCVCTARPELLERRPDWGGGKRNATTISLSPLSETDTARLVFALLDQSVLPAEMQSALLARAGGNPLYAEEYVRMLQDRGLDDAGQLPETVQGIIAARLDALPTEEKDVLQDAAVLGKVVWVGALAQITGLARWTAEERLHALERKEFVRREQHSSIAGETEYAFRHILVRDVAYGQIPRSRRGDKHSAVAEWIESMARGEEHSELLAHHYLEALEYGKAAGRETGDLADRGRFALRMAGDRAVELASAAPAVRFYRAALELWPEDDPDRGELMLREVESRWAVSGSAAVADDAIAARDTVLAAGRNDLAAEAELLVANIFWYYAEQGRSSQHLAEAQRLAEGLATSRTKAQVLAQVSRYHMLGARYESAVDVGRQALEMAEALGLPVVQATALNNIGTARASLGDPGGIVDLERAIEIASAAKNVHEQGRALINLAVIMVSEGELERAQALEREAGEVARDAGEEIGIRWSDGNLIKSHYWHGDWDGSVRLAGTFIHEAEAGSVHYLAAQAYYNRAAIRIARGEPGAIEDVERALELAEAASDPQVVVPTRMVAVHVLWTSGERDRPRELLNALAESTETLLSALPNGLCEVAWLIAELGATERFLELLGLAPPSPWIHAARLVATGDLSGAAELYDRIGARPEAAYCRLRSGDPSHLETALAFYRSVGASRYAHECEQLLAATA